MFLFKFRGQSSNKKNWHYGDYAKGRIFCNDGSYCVDPLTVGCFTGFFDYNGKEIYQDDIVQELEFDDDDNEIYVRMYLYVIKWSPYDSGFKHTCENDIEDITNWFAKDAENYCYPGGIFDETYAKKLRVVGNIFDDRELIENYTKELQEKKEKDLEEWKENKKNR